MLGCCRSGSPSLWIYGPFFLDGLAVTVFAVGPSSDVERSEHGVRPVLLIGGEVVLPCDMGVRAWMEMICGLGYGFCGQSFLPVCGRLTKI